MQALQPEKQRDNTGDTEQLKQFEQLQKAHPEIAPNILLGLVQQSGNKKSKIAKHDIGILADLYERIRKTSRPKKEPDASR